MIDNTEEKVGTNTNRAKFILFKNPAMVIGLLLSSLYVLGLTFHQGFLRSLNIEETQFLMSVERTFFKGFLSIVTIGTEAILWMFVASMGVVTVAMLGSLIIEIIKKFNYDLFIASMVAKLNIKKYEHKDDDFVEFSLKILFNIGFAIFIYFGILLIIIASDKAGQAYGSKFMKDTESGAVVEKELILKNGGKHLKGFSIICSSSQCAYLVDGKTKILNHSDLISVDTTRKP